MYVYVHCMYVCMHVVCAGLYLHVAIGRSECPPALGNFVTPFGNFIVRELTV